MGDKEVMGDRGFIGLIILIIIGLALLKYFLNWDIFDAAESDEGKSTILYIRDIFNAIWGFIGTPVTFAWESVLKPLITVFWQTFQAFVDWARYNAQQGV